MWSIVRRFAVIALGVVASWLLVVLILNLTVYSPARSVQLYLSALEEGRFGEAAGIAGMSSVPAVLPEPSGSLSEPEVVGTRTLASGKVVVLAEYVLQGDTESSYFTLEPAGDVLGLFNTWTFSTKPTATLVYSIIGDERIDVNDVRLSTRALGVRPQSTVLVPGVYEASLTTPWVAASSTVARVTQPEAEYPLRLRVAPTNELIDTATTAIERYLEGCVAQEILQPIECPFGITISDRVVGVPAWTVLDFPVVSVTLGADRESWDVLAIGGVVEVTVSVQSLFDGSISEYSEIVSFLVEGSLQGTLIDEPVLTL